MNFFKMILFLTLNVKVNLFKSDEYSNLLLSC